MKQNITLAIDKELIKKARAIAARQNTSISGLLAGILREKVSVEEEYERSKARALAMMRDPPFRLGGKRMTREEVHDREGLRRF